jgi:hypothetical protein
MIRLRSSIMPTPVLLLMRSNETIMNTSANMMKLAISGMMLVLVQAASAQTFTVRVNGANDVPPNDSFVTGHGVLTLTGNTLSYFIAVNFTAPWTGEIHGPAGPETNAPVLSDLGRPGCAIPNPPNPGGCAWQGSLTLSSQQISDLLSGLWYVRAYFGGEQPQSIRGQIILDNDQDGVPDGVDECPNTPIGALVNSRGCSIEQLCPCEAAWKNHAEYVNCVRESTAAFVQEGLITSAESRAFLKQAANSNCGRR